MQEFMASVASSTTYNLQAFKQLYPDMNPCDVPNVDAKLLEENGWEIMMLMSPQPTQVAQYLLCSLLQALSAKPYSRVIQDGSYHALHRHLESLSVPLDFQALTQMSELSSDYMKQVGHSTLGTWQLKHMTHLKPEVADVFNFNLPYVMDVLPAIGNKLPSKQMGAMVRLVVCVLCLISRLLLQLTMLSKDRPFVHDIWARLKQQRLNRPRGSLTPQKDSPSSAATPPSLPPPPQGSEAGGASSGVFDYSHHPAGQGFQGRG